MMFTLGVSITHYNLRCKKYVVTLVLTLPLSPHDAFKDHITSLIFLQLKALE